jgi:CubicO group peptidase (beta-lactamase class C family)
MKIRVASMFTTNPSKMPIIVLFIFLFAGLTGCRQQVSDETTFLLGKNLQPLSNDQVKDLETYIRKTLKYLDVPGASVGIVLDGEIIYAKGFGVRDLDSQEPVTSQTVMNVGSTTKSMTTVLMATMVDDGIFSWETPVTDILPSFKLPNDDLTQKITMQDMVCNCSGLQEQKEWEFSNFNDLAAEDVIENLVNAKVKGRYRETFLYNSNMIATGGFLAAMAAGGTYGDLFNAYVEEMGSRFLDPVGMGNSTFSIDAVRSNGNYATPYTITLPDENTPIPLEIEGWLTPFAPAAGLWSTAEDMAYYMIMQLNEGVAANGERVVSAENLLYTWDPKVKITPDATYGLGLVNEEYHGLRMMYHSGGTAGYTSEMVFFPEVSLGIIVLDNQMLSSFPMAVRYRILELMFGIEHSYDDILRDQVGDTRRQLFQLRLVATGKHDLDNVSQFLGTYENDVIGDVDIIMSGSGDLVFDAGEYDSILWRMRIEDDTYIFRQGLWIGKTFKFNTNQSGSVSFTIQGDEGSYTFRKK